MPPAPNRYETYQPTGVEWLPEIPVGWEVKRFKFIANTQKGRIPTELFSSPADTVAPYLAMDYLRGNPKQLWYATKNDGNSIEVKDGNLLLLWDGSNAGEFMAGKAGILSSTMGKITLRIPIDEAYFFHYAKFFERILKEGTIGMGIPHVNPAILADALVPLPPLAEQRAIARFLDDKTAQLDQLITQKQQMLALLREERAALLNHAVTQGLDAAAPRRDSGVEWLGEVPAHWEVKRLKWIAAIQGGIALSAGKKLENPVTLPYLRVANVQDGYLDLSEVKTVEVEADQVARYTLHKGDLLMNEGGDNDKLGRGCVWQGEVEPCLHQNHVFAVRLFNSYNPEWLNLITTTEGARTHFLTRAKQSTNLASISSSNIRELPVLLPPIAEQQEIMAFVAEKFAEIAETTDTINQEIALLQEYRAALIAEAVTGQLDVRDYAPAAAEILM